MWSLSFKRRRTQVGCSQYWPCYRQHHVLRHQPIKFLSIRNILGRFITLYRFSRWQQRRRRSTSSFGLGDVNHLRPNNFGEYFNPPPRCYCVRFFPKNKQPPYRKSISDFGLALVCGNSISFCICSPAFSQKGLSLARLWRHSA